jgi:hypothetical protein
LLRFYTQSTTIYPVTSANAFNIWGAVAFWRNDSSGEHVLRVAGVPALYVGTAVFVAAVAFVLWWVHRAFDRAADDARVLTVAAAAVSLLGFLMLTRMHERYMFLSLICLAPLAVSSSVRRWYAALCALFVLNLWLPYASQGSSSAAWKPEPLFSWVFGTTTDSWQRKVWSLAVTGIGLMVLRSALRWAGRPVAKATPKPLSSAQEPAPEQGLLGSPGRAELR